MDASSPHDRAERLESIFEEALALGSDERREFLDRVCAEDDDVRRDVEALLDGFDAHAGDVRRFFRGVHERAEGLATEADLAKQEDLAPEESSMAAPNTETSRPEVNDLTGLFGRHVEQYQILERLGGGGMGVVYTAHDRRLDRTVALKFLPPHLHGDAEAQARFIREARAASALDHTNICTIHEVGETGDGRTFIVMAYYEGETLKRKLARGPLPISEAIDYAIQIARGLQKAHAAGIVHRDIKPANLLVTSDGVVKILDFGIAKMGALGLTSSGVALGTVTYMSPEQARGQPVDHRTDIWSLGVVLYELLTGTQAFRGDYAASVMFSVLNDEPEPLRSLRPDASVHLEEVLGKSLAKRADERFQSMDELLEALGRPSSVVRASFSGRTPARRRSRDVSRMTRRTISYVAVAAILGALAFAVAQWNAFTTALPPGQTISSVVVLPPQLLSSQADEEYLAAGMHDALINALARIGSLRVISRTSAARYAQIDRSVPEIARELKVDGVVEASVYREGGRIHVDVRLVQAVPEERQLWAQAFAREFEHAPAMHGEVAQAIAREIRVSLSPEERRVLSADQPMDAAAYEAYLRGMFDLNKGTPEDFERGLAYLQEAVERDPGSALAYSGLALGYVTLGHGPDPPPDAWLRARAAAERAVRLDSTLAEAWAALADVKSYFEWDWEGAERAFHRANELNPNLAMNHYHYAWYLILFDRVEESLAAHRRAQELDPLTPLHAVWMPGVYLYTGRYEEALAAARRTVEEYPDHPSALYVLGVSAAQLGEFEEAIAAHEKMASISDRWTAQLGRTYAVSGRPDEARRILAELEARPPTSWGAIGLADLHAALGNTAEAFRWLDYEPAHGWLPWSKGNPALEHLRHDPRFDALMARLDLQK